MLSDPAEPRLCKSGGCPGPVPTLALPGHVLPPEPALLSLQNLVQNLIFMKLTVTEIPSFNIDCALLYARHDSKCFKDLTHLIFPSFFEVDATVLLTSPFDR